jgi:hypothetical protein
VVRVLGVLAQVDLHPVDLPVEAAGARGVVGAHGRAGLVADVGGLILGEDDPLCLLDPALANLLAVTVERDGAPLPMPPPS